MGIKVDLYGQDQGVGAVGVVRIESDVNEEETITIGSDVYEFDGSDNGVVTSGAIAITGHTNDTPSKATDALIATINTYATNGVRAIDIDANEVLLVTKGVSDESIALAETMIGANNTVTAAVANGNTGNRYGASSRVPTALEVGTGRIHIGLPFDPVAVVAQVRVTATGALKAWDGDVIVTAASGDNPAYVTVTNDGAVDWAATDTVSVIAGG